MTATTTVAPMLVLVGTSHRRAPVQVRERLYLAADDAAELARELTEQGGEAVVLSTCNRTEVYLAHRDPLEAAARARAALARRARDASGEVPVAALSAVQGDEVAVHLFRVAAGLDSPIPGEGQILGQVRAAHEAGLGLGTSGPVLNRLFRQALQAGKRVRAETAIAEQPGSVPAAAARVARRVFGTLDGRRVLIIGAGKMSELAARDLASGGVQTLFVANRTPARAESLARRCGGEAVTFEQLGGELERADVVISSTRCPRLVLSAGEVARAIRRRERWPLVFIDIAVPRDLDPAIGRLDGCRLYDIDDLGDAAGASIAVHRRERMRAEAMLAEEVGQFRAWADSRRVVPAITSLRRHAEAIRAAELERAEPRLRSLSPSQRRAVETLTAQIVNKLLHVPTVRMKEAALSPDGGDYAAAVERFFGLGERWR